ncbi:MAG TPA: hypothetical protein VKA87_06195 [Nitrososphaeraceae archaeon]|nr:hypothetical protein [Nitrososphaeraceae archaeon]
MKCPRKIIGIARLPEGGVECIRRFTCGKPKTRDVISARATNLKKIHSTMNTSIFLRASKIGLARWVGFIVHILKTQVTEHGTYCVRDMPEEKLRENGISR